MRFKLFVMVPLFVFAFSLSGIDKVYFLSISLKDDTAVMAQMEDTGDSNEGASSVDESHLEDPLPVIEIEAEKDSDKGCASVETPAAVKPDIPQTDKSLKIVAVGDVMLGRGVGGRLDSKGLGYIHPFEKVVGLLKDGDIIFGNLEPPMTESTHSLDKNMKYVLKSRTEAIDGIKYAGFNLMNLANNHIMDYYDKGLFDTMQILDENGIKYSGAGRNMDEARKPAIIEAKGLNVGMLAYTDMAEYIFKGNPSISFVAGTDKAGVAPRKMEFIEEDMEKIREDVDILIISLHWGIEESFEVPHEQVEFAHRVLDSGADIILGHHPHQFQGMEIYNGKPIIYSMGNFIFDQNDPENQESFILCFEYINGKFDSLTATPIKTVEKIQVEVQAGLEAEGILKREIELSSKLGTKFEIEDERLVYRMN